MAKQGIHLTLRTLNGEDFGEFELQQSDRVARLASLVRKATGDEPRQPQFIWNDVILSWSAIVKNIGLPDGAVIQVVWRPVVSRPPMHGDRILPIRPLLDQNGLDAKLLERAHSNSIDLAGHLIPESPECKLADRLPEAMVALDVRQCMMRLAQMEALFNALPPSLTSLRASRNAISPDTLKALIDRCGANQLKVLDLGSSDADDYEEVDCDWFEIASLLPLLGEWTEELGLDSIRGTPADVVKVAQLCPSLRKLDLCNARCGLQECSPAWEALSQNCPKLEFLNARYCNFSPSAVSNLVQGCRNLKTLVLGEGVGLEGLQTLVDSGFAFDIIDVVVESAEEVAVATQLDVGWLTMKYEGNGEGEIDPRKWDAAILENALVDISAVCVELSIPALTEASLTAAAERVRSIDFPCYMWSHSESGHAILPVLAAAAPHCSNLEKLSINYWEQISPGHLATIAAHCQHLEMVSLNADKRGFQVEAIDDGVRALGVHCQHMRHLDLYDRRMDNPAQALADACSGWPRLEYLCILNTKVRLMTMEEAEDDDTEENWDVPEDLCLPKALAAHCPLLFELECNPQPNAWEHILREGCPLLKDIRA